MHDNNHVDSPSALTSSHCRRLFKEVKQIDIPVGPVGNVGKSRCFSARLSQAAVEIHAFVDSHGCGIFHQPIFLILFTHKFR
jgi:hypothetical protein